ncbi:MAG: hypothetical protein ACOVSW_16415 [Candidatus Kapaibacteriota bacterium]
MKSILRNAARILAFSALYSCEYRAEYAFTVLDNATKRPLDSVLVTIRLYSGGVERTAYRRTGYTNTLGMMKKSQMIGSGLSTSRSEHTISFEKTGYKMVTEENLLQGTILLER